MGLLSSIKNMLASTDHAYVLEGEVDWHSHLLPGVDDGVRTHSESLEILSSMERRGVREIWLTPHIMEDMPNTTTALKSVFKELTDAYEGSVRLHLASENMLDALFAERLKNSDFLPIGRNSDMLLVETSFYNPPSGLSDLLFSLRSVGLTPLLAHPERYRYMTEDDYRTLHSQGVRFQLNLMSLKGHYGPMAKVKARHLLNDGMYYCCGSDIHHNGHIPILDRVTVRDGKNLAELRHRG